MKNHGIGEDNSNNGINGGGLSQIDVNDEGINCNNLSVRIKKKPQKRHLLGCHYSNNPPLMAHKSERRMRKIS